MKIAGIKFCNEAEVKKTYPLDSMFMFFFTILFIILTPLFYNSLHPAMSLLSVIGAIWCGVLGVQGMIPSTTYYQIASIEGEVAWFELIDKYEIINIMKNVSLDEENTEDAELKTYLILRERE